MPVILQIIIAQVNIFKPDASQLYIKWHVRPYWFFCGVGFEDIEIVGTVFKYFQMNRGIPEYNTTNMVLLVNKIQRTEFKIKCFYLGKNRRNGTSLHDLKILKTDSYIREGCEKCEMNISAFDNNFRLQVVIHFLNSHGLDIIFKNIGRSEERRVGKECRSR